MTITQRDINNNAILTKRDKRRLRMSLSRVVAYRDAAVMATGLIVGLAIAHVALDLSPTSLWILAIGGALFVAATMAARRNIVKANRAALCDHGVHAFIDSQFQLYESNVNRLVFSTIVLAICCALIILAIILFADDLGFVEWFILVIFPINIAIFAYQIYATRRWLTRLPNLTEEHVREALGEVEEEAAKS